MVAPSLVLAMELGIIFNDARRVRELTQIIFRRTLPPCRMGQNFLNSLRGAKKHHRRRKKVRRKSVEPALASGPALQTIRHGPERMRQKWLATAAGKQSRIRTQGKMVAR